MFNNRFIKLFWHKEEDNAGQGGAAAKNAAEAKRQTIKDRLGAIPPAHKLQLNNTKKNQDAAKVSIFTYQ